MRRASATSSSSRSTPGARSHATARRPAFFVEQAAGVTATDAAEFLYDERNESIVVARTEARVDRARARRARDRAHAAVARQEDRRDLRRRHAAQHRHRPLHRLRRRAAPRARSTCATRSRTKPGHLLGLGHSMVAGSTMFDNNATPGDIEKRTLEADDIAGYCSLDLPSFNCKSGDCACPAATGLRVDPQRQHVRLRAARRRARGLRSCCSAASCSASLLLAAPARSPARRRQRGKFAA